MTVWTVGHSNRSLEEFLNLLQSHGIVHLADVRRFPGSRRHPHFQGDSLAEILRGQGIRYRHFETLGGRRKPRPESPNTGWRHEAFRGYADYMMTPEFMAAAHSLLEYASEAPTVIMCAEALWWQCHRRLLADYLTALGHEVLHIQSPTTTEAHRLVDPARLVGGRLSYQADPEQLALL